MGAILEAIQAKLTAAFQPIRLEVVDDSARHAGHAGASPEGESHFNVTIEAQANEEGHLYGSIGANDISKQLKTAGFSVEPEQIRLEGPLKELAMYTVKIQLHADIESEVKVWVVPTATAK